nr:MAG TPA: repressor domain protein [Caudoviricetes sp.]
MTGRTTGNQRGKSLSISGGNNPVRVFKEGTLGSIRVITLDGEPWFVGKDVAKILGYHNPNEAVRDHVDREDKMLRSERGSEILRQFGTVKEMQKELGKQDGWIINKSGLYSLVFSSRLPAAKRVKHWVMCNVLPAIRKQGGYEIADVKSEVAELRKSIDMFLRPFVNPRYTFENLKVRYWAATKDTSARGFYDSISDWTGIKLPYSFEIPITVRDWILQYIDLEDIQDLVNGITAKTIVRSDAGHWVDLGGYGANGVEWEKIVRTFNRRCAYCGKEAPLIPEHIVPQTVLSRESPEKVDRIGNIVCACASCNESKGRHDFAMWYERQSFFTEYRKRKILNHIRKYRITGGE